MTTSSELTALVARLSSTGAEGATEFDLAGDPPGVESLGREIAALVSDLDVNAVLGWWTPEETVFAHVIAAALGVQRSGAERDLGLLTVAPALPAGARVLVVATAFNPEYPLAPLETMLAGGGHVLVAALSLDSVAGVRVDRRA